MYAIVIDGELVEADKLHNYGYLPMIDEGNMDWYLAENSDMADEKAKDTYREMDAKELICMVGEEQIVEMWTSGRTLEDWLEGIDADSTFGTYNGDSSEVYSMTDYLVSEFGDLEDWIKELEYPKSPQKPIKNYDETYSDFGLRMDAHEKDKAKWVVLRDEYHQAVGRIEDSFRQALFVELGIENHPKRDKFYAKAWEHGHSSGLHNVANDLVDLLDLM